MSTEEQKNIREAVALMRGFVTAPIGYGGHRDKEIREAWLSTARKVTSPVGIVWKAAPYLDALAHSYKNGQPIEQAEKE